MLKDELLAAGLADAIQTDKGIVLATIPSNVSRAVPVVALNAHSPIHIPLVVDEESEIDLVTVNDKPCWLYLDGNITNAPKLRRGDVVQVRRGEHTFATIHLDGMNFYEAVRGRFNFLIRPEAIPSRSAKR